MERLPSVPEKCVGVAVGDIARGLTVDGRDDVSLTNAFERRLTARVYLHTNTTNKNIIKQSSTVYGCVRS